MLENKRHFPLVNHFRSLWLFQMKMKRIPSPDLQLTQGAAHPQMNVLGGSALSYVLGKTLRFGGIQTIPKTPW